MGIRRRVNRKGSGQKPSSSESDMLQHFLTSRPFGDGKKVKSPQLPTTEDILRPRPFTHQNPQPVTPEDIPRIQAQLEAGEEFGFSGFNMPAFGPQSTEPIQAASPIGAKLTVAEPNDRYEQEADSVAAPVVEQINSPTNQQATQGQTVQRQDIPKEEEEQPVQAKLESGTIQRDEMPAPEEEQQPVQAKLESGTIQRDEMPAPEEEEQQPVQAKLMVQRQPAEGGMTATPDLEESIESARGGGKAIADNIREPMEQAMGADLSGVRIHTDAQSDQLNRSIQARAFTTGEDVFFRQGEYDPGSRQGQELMAHEFTHVLQQNPHVVQRQMAGVIQRQDETLGMTVSQSVTDGPYGWTSAYDLEITDQDCIVTIKVRTNPDPDVSAEDLQRVQSETANEFARYFDRRFNLRDDSGTARPLQVRLQFVDSGEHLLINLHSGSGRDNLSNWFVDSEPIDRAHELGHQLGLKDEYVDASVANRATATSPGVFQDNSLMGNYYTEGIRNADVRQRHGDQLAADISVATGMNFTAERRNIYIVRQGDNLSNIALRIYGNEAMWQEIYNLNRDQISNPDLIFPGQELNLPPVSGGTP